MKNNSNESFHLQSLKMYGRSLVLATRQPLLYIWVSFPAVSVSPPVATLPQGQQPKEQVSPGGLCLYLMSVSDLTIYRAPSKLHTFSIPKFWYAGVKF